MILQSTMWMHYPRPFMELGAEYELGGLCFTTLIDVHAINATPLDFKESHPSFPVAREGKEVTTTRLHCSLRQSGAVCCVYVGRKGGGVVGEGGVGGGLTDLQEGCQISGITKVITDKQLGHDAAPNNRSVRRRAGREESQLQP